MDPRASIVVAPQALRRRRDLLGPLRSDAMRSLRARLQWRTSGRHLSFALVAGLGVLAAACNDSSSSAAPTTSLRAVHASADAPNVDVTVNGKTVLTNVPYKTASGFLSVPAGTTTLSVQPTGTSTAVINESLSLSASQQYSAVVIGLASPSAAADEQLRSVLVDDPGNAPAAGNVKVRVLHGAPGVPPVDLYVTAPGVPLPSSPTVSALAYAGLAPASGVKALEVPGGNYQIRAVVSGTPAQSVAFDSGPVTLPAGADLLVTAIPASGVSPVSLLVAPGTGAPAEIADTRAAVRVAHLAPNVPAVDVSLDVTGTSTNVLTLPNVAFPADSGYALVPAGSYDASVALASNPMTPVLSLDNASLAGNTSTSVFAIGLLGASGAQAPQLVTFTDDRIPAADKAKVRVIHLAPDAPAVDVVVLAADGSIAATLVSNLAYPKATSGYLQVAPGSYSVAVVPTGATTPVLPMPAGVPVTLKAGQIVTVAAVGCLNISTGPCANGAPFQFKLFSDN